jgi:hypothetical protein
MDLVKLVAELREYRAQVQEAIAALEDLARRRHDSSNGSKVVGRKSPQRRGRKPKPGPKLMDKPNSRKKKSS